MLALAFALAASAHDPGLSLARTQPEVVPAPLDWTPEEWAQLSAGQVVWRYERDQGHDLGVAARLTQATPDAIWQQVLRFDDWVLFLPYVTHSSTEQFSTQAGHPVVDARFALTFKGITTWHDIRHHAFLEAGYLAFHLLETTRSPLRGTTGYWTVEGMDRGTLVAFRADLSPAWYVPGAFRKKAARVGLPRLVRLMVERVEEESLGIGSRAKASP